MQGSRDSRIIILGLSNTWERRILVHFSFCRWKHCVLSYTSNTNPVTSQEMLILNSITFVTQVLCWRQAVDIRDEVRSGVLLSFCWQIRSSQMLGWCSQTWWMSSARYVMWHRGLRVGVTQMQMRIERRMSICACPKYWDRSCVSRCSCGSLYK